MKPGERIYNKATDKHWSSEVYHKAREVIAGKLSAIGHPLQFDCICEAMKQQYPYLCDDAIRDPRNPQSVYWKHLVASAIQGLKKEGKVDKADNGWVWKGVKPLPSPRLLPPSATPDEPDKLAKEIRDLLENLVGLAKKEKKEKPRPSHDELVQRVKEMGEMLGKVIEPVTGALYKHDCVWRDNPYANPRLVVEVCDKGNLDKDIASLIWAVKNWGAKSILVLFEESDFYTAQNKLAQESQIYPLKVEDVLKLHSLLQAGNTQAIRSIFTV